MIDISALRAMAAAGATVEIILAAIEADQKTQLVKLAERRAKDAERQRRKRASVRDGHAVSRGPSDGVRDPPSSSSSSPSSSDGFPEPLPITPPSPPPPSPSPARSLRSRGTRLADDWIPSLDDQSAAIKIGLKSEQIQIEGEKFRDYWHARAGPGGVKCDWPATWRNWCRKVKENGPTNGIRRPKSLSERAFDLADEARRRELAAGIGRADDPFGGHRGGG